MRWFPVLVLTDRATDFVRRVRQIWSYLNSAAVPANNPYRPDKAAETTENVIPTLNYLPTPGPSSSPDRYGHLLRGGHAIVAAQRAQHSVEPKPDSRRALR